MAKPVARGKYDRAKTTVERTKQRHELLLDAAAEVFAARGYVGTRVDDIVERAGVSRRTLYQHFESVEAILHEVYERAVRTSFQIVFDKLAGIDDPIERIRGAVEAYYQGIADRPALAHVVFDVYRHAGPMQAARYEANGARYTLVLFELLTAAHAAGRFRRAPDETTTYALSKALEAIAVRTLDRGEHARLVSLAPVMSTLILDAFGYS